MSLVDLSDVSDLLGGTDKLLWIPHPPGTEKRLDYVRNFIDRSLANATEGEDYHFGEAWLKILSEQAWLVKRGLLIKGDILIRIDCEDNPWVNGIGIGDYLLWQKTADELIYMQILLKRDSCREINVIRFGARFAD